MSQQHFVYAHSFHGFEHHKFYTRSNLIEELERRALKRLLYVCHSQMLFANHRTGSVVLHHKNQNIS
eukprot:scaffold10205_cov224-Chaetoceros_neogracile.AAC.2